MNLSNGIYSVDEEPIGKGRTSKVFKGLNNQTNGKICVKKMRKITEAEEETDILKEVPPHPHLIKFYDYFAHDGNGYIVTEYHPGNRLGYYRSGEKHPEKFAIEITINILKGLGALHEAKILHCDLSPHNILIEKQNSDSIKIIDFGCAVFKNENDEYKGTHKGGTLGYYPPELKRHATHLNNSSDLYSAACICLYLITGKAPFKLKQALEQVDNKELREVLRKVTDSNKSNRFQDANELSKALLPFLSN